MARYIDADKVHEGIEAIQTSLKSNNDEIWRINKPYYKGLAIARGVINETPTADVAPRKENDVPRYIKLPQPEFLQPTAEELEAFATKLYQSPIEIIMQEMQTQLDDEVFKATQAYGVNVDKDELIKALEYDRDQYNKGFADGSRIDTTAIRAEVAREIFEEIEKIIEKHHSECYEYEDGDECDTAITYISYLSVDIDDLKKKYTEGKDDT